MGEVLSLQAAQEKAAIETDREIINRCLAQIRATGWLVSIAEDRGESVIVDVFDGEGTCYRMLIDAPSLRA